MLKPHAVAVMAGRYTTEKEAPEDVFVRVANYYASPVDENPGHAERLLHYMKNLWWMPATPILANGGTDRALPISCFLSNVQDSRRSLSDHFREVMFMSTEGGGCGVDWSAVRSAGQMTSKGIATSGMLQAMHMFDGEVMFANQGGVRKAAYASYVEVEHTDLLKYVDMRKASKGDIHSKNLNLHHGINISDTFMLAVIRNEMWTFRDPHSGMPGQTMKAREVWRRILSTRSSDGEPYLHFVDASNRAMHPDQKALGLKIGGSNLCVAYETKILTDAGQKEIGSLAGKTVNVWNGSEWSEVVIRETGVSSFVRVALSNGTFIDCTPDHKFLIPTGSRNRGFTRVSALDLLPGQKLQKWELPSVVETGTKKMSDAYTHGLFCADGTYGINQNPLLRLYGEKKQLVSNLAYRSGGRNVHPSSDRVSVNLHSELEPKFLVPFDYAISERIKWLAGLIDGDGHIQVNKESKILVISNTNIEFLRDVRLMLQTLGVESKIQVLHEEKMTRHPDHRGGHQEYFCKKVYRLQIPTRGYVHLRELGLQTFRVRLEDGHPKFPRERFVTVESVTELNREEMSYCFTEPKRNLGMFNGILTGNCTEITLAVNEERSAVCCLSSLNLDTIEQWETNREIIPDVLEFLDNVLSDFIRKAPPELSKAVFSASRERAVGLGVMGFSDHFQKNMIAMESLVAIGRNKQIFKSIKEQADAVNKKLGALRGPAPDLVNSGDRFSNMLAIAPTANISVIADTTPSIEPVYANVYNQPTRSGSLEIRNKYLVPLIEDRFKPHERNQVWLSIIGNNGSIQHLPDIRFNQGEKEVFKTAFELDQRSLIRLAADRQQYICQAQSMNLFFPENVPVKYYNECHIMAWDLGLKSLYYVRSRPIRNSGLVSYDKEGSDCSWCQ